MKGALLQTRACSMRTMHSISLKKPQIYRALLLQNFLRNARRGEGCNATQNERMFQRIILHNQLFFGTSASPLALLFLTVSSYDTVVGTFSTI